MKTSMLEFVAGPGRGGRHAVGGPEVLLGRDPRCDVVLPSLRASRRHARLVRRPDGHYLEDLGSAAGTSINGREIASVERLSDGDRLAFGDCEVVFRAPEAARPVILDDRDTSSTMEHGLVGVLAEQKLAAMLRLSRALSGGPGLEQALERTLEVLFEVFPGAERGLVVLGQGGSLRPMATRARGHRDRPLRCSRAVYEHVAGRGRAVLVQDVGSDGRFAGSASVDEAEIRTLMAVPLRDHSKAVVGLLQLDTGEPRAGFAPADLDLLAAVAIPIGLAVDNARLLGDARRERDRLSLLARVGEALGSSLDIDSLLDALAGSVVAGLADLCLVDLLEEGGEVRRVAARHADCTIDRSMTALMQYAPDPAGAHPAMRAIREGRTLAFRAPAPGAEMRGEEHRRLVELIDPGDCLCIPLTARGRTLGVLSLGRMRASRGFDDADRTLAEEVARRAATAADNASLYAAAERARRLAEVASLAKDRLMATLSHELRTPLTPALLAVTGLLEDPRTPAELREPLEAARRGVELQARLVDDLLDATRAGAGKLRLNREGVDLHAVVREAIGTCRGDLEDAGLALDLQLSARCTTVHGDPVRLQQVVWNLLRNAAKFTPRGGSITVRSRDIPRPDGGAGLVLDVIDTGAGIEPALLERIFEPFEQGGADREVRSGGLGLGLAIARGVAEAHGGRLTASSDGPGRGATFTLELLARATTVTRPADPRTGEGRRRAARPGGRLLLVEDDEASRNVLARLLRLGGWEVVTAARLDAALEAAGAGPFDLLVSDLDLPDGSGLELARRIAGPGRVPAIALSGHGTERDAMACREAGFSDHLTKPVSFRALDERIGAVLSRIRLGASRGQDAVPPRRSCSSPQHAAADAGG